MESNKTTRRAVLAGGATIPIVALGYHLTTDSTSAQIDDSNFTIPDKEHQYTGEINEVILSVDIDFSYESDSSPDSYAIRLEVGQDELELADFHFQNDNPPADLSESITLEADLLDNGFRTSQFVPDGSDESVSVNSRITLEITNSGETVASDELTESFEIVILDNGVELDFDLEASGTVTIS